MTSKDSHPEDASEMRRQAESIVREQSAQRPENLENLSPQEIQPTLHELRVHQIELEMQNEELRRAQVELDATRARYFDLYDLAPVGYCTLSEHGLILEANLAAATLLGVDRGALVSQPVSRFILKDDQDIYYLLRKHLFETGDPQVRELRMVRPDETVFWAPLEAAAARDSEGAPVCRAVLSDITVRKREDAYGEMRREILQLLNAPGGLADTIRRVLSVLKKGTGCGALGIRLQDGEDFPYLAQEGFSSDFLRTENSLAVRAVGGGVCREEHGNVNLECTCGLVISGKTDPSSPFFTRGGSFWTNNSMPLLELPSDQDPRHHPRNRCIHEGFASVALVPVRSGDRIVGLLQLNDRRSGCFTIRMVELLEGIAAHIGTALMRRQAGELVRKSEERNRAILQTAMDGFWRVDLQGRILETNEAYCRMSGYSASELLAMRVPDIEAAETAEDTAAHIQKVMAQGSDRFESRHRRKDGTVFDVEVSVQYRPDEGSELVVFSRDIGERKQWEATLQSTADELTRSNKDLESFARVASHDLQAPLRTVRSFAQLLQKNYGGKMDPDANEMIGFLIGGADRMHEIITDLLAYARAGSATSLRTPTKTQDALSAALLSLREAMQVAGAIVTNDALPTVLADRGQVTQLFQNLIGNAIKFRRESEEPKVHISARSEDNGWTFSVRDNGIGIDPVYFEKVFSVFQRLHTSDEYPGTGIGLSICMRIIERHGGRIWLESSPGNGATFFFTLPAMP